MDISKEITQLQDRVRQLHELHELALQISDTACQLEAEISSIDESLPNPKKLSEIKDKSERVQLAEAEELLKEAYSIVDEILGPPEDEIFDHSDIKALSPEARGSKDMSIEEIMKQFSIGRKGNAS
ncbi:MAG: hypothetical protein MJY89_02295 [Bacteroidales bacterium]|nr:hypothetical protein [Bacteroidales bacterium]